MKKTIIWVAKTINTLLDIGSFGFIGFLAYNAYLGNMYTFGSLGDSLRNAAIAVVFLVTLTWISNYALLSNDFFESKLAWFAHFFQMIIAVIIDVGIAASFMLELVFPAQFAILVIILHVIMNVITGVMHSIDHNKHLFTKELSPQEENEILKANLIQTQTELGMVQSKLSFYDDDNKNITLSDTNKKKVTATCDICGWTREYDNTQSADFGLRIHKGRAHKQNKP